jgi:hypothetical protein
MSADNLLALIQERDRYRAALESIDRLTQAPSQIDGLFMAVSSVARHALNGSATPKEIDG